MTHQYSEHDWQTPIRGRRRDEKGQRLLDMPDLRALRKQVPAPASLASVLEARVRERSRLDQVEREVTLLKDRLESLEARCAVHTVEIHTFAPEPYVLKKPIPITVRWHDEEFLASFVDANVNVSGETEAEVLASIKALILDVWESLQNLSRSSTLGPKLNARLSVLGEYIDGPTQGA